MSEITVRLGFLEANDLLSGLLLLRTAEEDLAERIKVAGVYPQDTMEFLARLARTERKLRDAMRIPARTGLPVEEPPLFRAPCLHCGAPDHATVAHPPLAETFYGVGGGFARVERVLAASEDDNPEGDPTRNGAFR